MSVAERPPLSTIPVADVPDLAAQVKGLGFLLPDEAARLDRLERATYVLVRMDQGEYWRCRECGGRHVFKTYGPVFTKHCVPRPWRGLTRALYAYTVNAGARLSDLSPEQRRTVSALLPRARQSGHPTPLLAELHPQSARALQTPESDLEYVAWALGSVVEITAAEAGLFQARINSKAGRPLVRL